MGFRTVRPRSIAAPFLVLVSLLTALCGVMNALVPHDWGIGDWLINYRAGFVRRGLPGEIIFYLSHLTRISPTWIVLALQLFFYAVILWSFWKLLEKSSCSLWIIALVLSPATLLFPVLDPSFGYRKEEIFLAGLGLLLVALLRPLSRSTRLVALLAVFCPIAVLSHEGLVFYLPYIVAALAIALGSIPRALRLSALPILLALLAAVLAAHYPGNATTASRICDSLHYGATCPESILYLSRDSRIARQDVAVAVQHFQYKFVYGRAIAFALLPILVGFGALARVPRLRRDLAILASASALSIAGSLILFLYGSDWGRWIYIHIVSVFLLLLFIDIRRQADPQLAQATRSLSLTHALGFGILMLVYMSFWQLGAYRPHFPLAGFVHTVYEYKRNYWFIGAGSALPPP